MKVHLLKSWPMPFRALRKGDKTFELRVNDRDYATGDVLVLREWVPQIPAPQGSPSEPGRYTGEIVVRGVSYMTDFPVALQHGCCAMGLRPASWHEHLEAARALNTARARERENTELEER